MAHVHARPLGANATDPSITNDDRSGAPEVYPRRSPSNASDPAPWSLVSLVDRVQDGP